ncbi:MAG: DUF6017 domain-containing protein [Clostridia bacterium]
MAVFRIEKTKDYTVMANHHLKNRELSLKAKGLLSMILSLPESWNYTTRGLASICKEGVDCIGAALKELEDAGYIMRNRLRDEKGRITDTEYVIFETPNPNRQQAPTTSQPANRPDTALPHTAQPCTAKPYTDEQSTEKTPQLNTNESNKDQIKYENQSINPITNVSRSSKPNPSLADEYRRTVRRNIDYDDLTENSTLSEVQLDEIVELLVETLCSQKPTIAVASDELPASLVKDRLLKLNSTHIEYVMDSMKKNTGAVRNIKRYLLTALFNASATIDHYYTAVFNHDYYGGGSRERTER